VTETGDVALVSRCGKNRRTLNQPVYPVKQGKSPRKSPWPDEGRVHDVRRGCPIDGEKGL